MLRCSRCATGSSGRREGWEAKQSGWVELGSGAGALVMQMLVWKRKGNQTVLGLVFS